MVYIVDGQGNVEWLGKWGLLERGTKVRGMSSLDSEDGAGCSEIVLAHDVGSGTKVGRDTNALQDGSGSHEHIDISDAESICALRNGSGARSYKMVSLRFMNAFKNGLTFQSCGEEGDMSGLIAGDLL